MIHITLRRLFWSAVFFMSVLAGGGQLAHAAVMMEPLPDSANLPENISGVTSSSVQSGNRIMVTGGQKANSSTFARYSYTFNPTDRSWTSLAPPLQLSFHKQSMLKDGRVLVTGGSKFVPGTGYVYNNVVKIYSPYSNTWSDGASLPVGSIFGNTQSTLLDGRVLIVGGANEIWSGVDRNTMYNQAYLYDPGMNRWEEAAPYPYPIYDAAQSTLKDGRVLVTGGQSHYVYRFDAYLYDPSNNTWTKAANLPFEGDTFFRHAQVTLPNGKVLVMGKKYFYIYDPATNQWTKDTATIRQLTNAQLSVFGNDVYAMGGYDENWETNVNVYKLTFDFTPPTAPAISGPGPEWSTQDVTAVITPGTDADSGVARTEYSLSGATTLGWTPYNDGDKITITNDGQTTISARTIDNAGNVSPIATAVVKIDRTAPTQPVVKLSAASWTASDVTVTITSGTDNGGSGVNRTEFSLSGATTLAWTTYTGLVTITAEGQTTVSARTIDNAGNISSVGTAVVSIDKTAPTAPAVIPATSQWTSAANVAVTITGGTDSGGSGVNRTEYRLTGATTLGWTTYTGPLSIAAEGQTTVSARTVDNAGNTSVIASTVVKIDRTAPTAPTLSAFAGSWTDSDVTVTITGGTDSGGSGVNRTEYSLTGATTLAWTAYTDPVTITAEDQTTVSARTIDNVGNISVIASTVVKIDRTAPTAPTLSSSAGSWTNSDVTVTITGGTDSGGSGVNRTEYSLSGATTLAWTAYTGPVTITAEGLTTVSARTVDNAGNLSSVSSAVVRIDRTPPVAPIVTAPLAGAVLPNNKPTVTGTAEANATVNVTLDGGVSLPVTADGSGRWSYTPATALADGVHRVKAAAKDAAGNGSPDSVEISFTIDTQPPAPPVIGTPVNGAWINSPRPVITGQAEAGATVALYLDATPVGTTTADGSGSWTYPWPTDLADGAHSLKATAADAAGNVSPASAVVSFTVDTQAPAAPVILAPADGTVTGSNRPVISGTAEAGTALIIDLDGTETAAGTANAGGSWSYSLPDALTDGGHAIKVRAKDTAGNISPASATVHFTVDTEAPAAPVILAPAEGTATKQSKPVIRGTAEANATVHVVVNGSPAGTVMADAGGNWTFIPPVALVDGVYTLRATAADAAGNISPLSAEIRFTVDTLAPPAPVVTSPANGAVTNRLKPSIAGTAEASITVSVYVDEVPLAETAADVSGRWSYTLTDSLAVGTHAVKAQATDAAGNTGPFSASHTFTVVSDNALLHTLQLSGVTLNETVTGTTYRYTAQVPHSVTVTTVTAVPADGNASVQVLQDGEAVSGPLRLRVGAQTITIQVTAQDGTTVQLYNVLVTRSPSSEVQLSELTLSHAALAPEFQGGTTRYAATVTNDVYALTVRAKAVSSEASIRINGQSFASGEAVLPVGLQVGANPITVAVTAQDGVTIQSYTVLVHRKPSSNVLLNGLLLSDGSLSPAFDSGIVHYEAAVEHGVTSMTVTASVYDPNALLTVNGREAVSHRPSQPVGLQVGINRLTIMVTAQDRDSTQAYTVEVTRKPSTNAGLTGLRLTDAALSPAFDSEITAYEANVGYPIDSTTVTASVYDPNARISINGKVALSGEASAPIALQVGATTIRITATAPDGLTVRTYTVRVHREAPPEQPSDSSSGGRGGGGGPAPAEEPKVSHKPAVPDKQPAVPDKLADIFAACVPVVKVRFTDMSGHWAESSVSEASGCGIVDGFDDGTFRPNEPVTRAQFIAMLVRANGLDKSGPTTPPAAAFADQEAIPSWVAEAVSMAAQRGIVNGYEDGSFRPDAQVTRAEMIAMAARASNLQAGPEAELSMFTDAAEVPDWATGYVAAARQHGLVQGRENGRFAPQEPTTRAEAAVLLLRWIRTADQ